MCHYFPAIYWGLRKYSGEQEAIWGGDEKCEHIWTETGGGLHHQNRNWHTGTQEEVKSSQGPLVNVGEDAHSQSGLCQKCNAWRGAFGLEPTIELYVEHTVQILREIKRVLRPDGLVFWNVGDSYAGSGRAGNNPEYQERHTMFGKPAPHKETFGVPMKVPEGLKPKDLCMVPFRVALAAQADGWWVRSDICWQKSNPMPEPVADRPTKSHEYIFMLAKSDEYFWDKEAVKEKGVWPAGTVAAKGSTERRNQWKVNARPPEYMVYDGTRNIRDVWTFPVQSYADKGEHWATFPEELPERCIKAASSERGNCPDCGAPWVRIIRRKKAIRTERSDKPNIKGLARCPSELDLVSTMGWRPTCSHYPRTNEWVDSLTYDDTKNPTPEEVSEDERRTKIQTELLEFWKTQKTVPALILDPFAGSGTTLWVARRLGRHAIGIDISNQYKELGMKRAKLDVPAIESYGE